MDEHLSNRLISIPIDSAEALRFATSVVSEIDSKKFVEASLFANVSVAQSQLDCNEVSEARTTLDTCQKQLDSLDEVENIVRAYFFKTNALYYQVSFVHFIFLSDFDGRHVRHHLR